MNTVYSVACVVGAWKVEGARKNGRVSPSRESVLSCAHYFPAPATKAIYSVTPAYRRQESDTWSQSKSGAWYTLLDWSRIFTSCFGRALVPPTKSWKHPTFFHSFISSHLMKSLAKSNEKRNCFLYQHCIKSQLTVHQSSLEVPLEVPTILDTRMRKSKENEEDLRMFHLQSEFGKGFSNWLEACILVTSFNQSCYFPSKTESKACDPQVIYCLYLYALIWIKSANVESAGGIVAIIGSD